MTYEEIDLGHDPEPRPLVDWIQLALILFWMATCVTFVYIWRHPRGAARTIGDAHATDAFILYSRELSSRKQK